MPLLRDLDLHDYCYIRTIGRVTGKPHEIEIWFALEGDTIYILAGGGHDSDWVKNVKKQPEVPVRIDETTYAGQARIVTNREEDALARRIVVAKYTSRGNDDLGEWGRTALPVAIDLTATAAGPR